MEKQLDLRKDSSVPHDATGPQGTPLSFPEDREKTVQAAAQKNKARVSLSHRHTLRNKTLCVHP